MIGLTSRAILGSVAASALLLAACGEAPETTTAEPAAVPTPAEDAMAALEPSVPLVTSGWVRTPPAGRDVTAGYLTLLAEGEDDQLIGASSAIAARIELHTMEDDGEVMRMRQVEAIDLPAGELVSLRPGGDHLMIFGVDTAALDGEVEITLEFASGAETTVRLPLSATEPQADAPASAGGHEKMDHSTMDHSGMDHGDAHQRGDYHEPTDDEGEEE